MKQLPADFITLYSILKKHGFSSYLIGGSSRDFLLGNDFIDFDVTTNARPDDLKNIFEDVDDTFSKYGSIKLKINGTKFDITTLRKENKYKDHRHPLNVEYVDDIKIDFLRRDFTINAIYIDGEGNVFDFSSGVSDLNNNLIRMIGDPDKRLKEDPLRIIRAIRFSLVLDFEIEESLQFAILKNAHLIAQLRPEKIKEEINKMIKAGISLIDIKKEFKQYHIVLPFKLN